MYWKYNNCRRVIYRLTIGKKIVSNFTSWIPQHSEKRKLANLSLGNLNSSWNILINWKSRNFKLIKVFRKNYGLAIEFNFVLDEFLVWSRYRLMFRITRNRKKNLKRKKINWVKLSELRRIVIILIN
jgi:hypothetical protein